MILNSRARRIVSAAIAVAFLAVAAPASAQQENISESHLQAARATVTAIKATQEFDKILPQAALALRSELIQKNPDLQEMIVQTVEEETLKLAARRADLEKEAALAYARVFSEQHLTEIAAFYNSDAGKQLLKDGTVVTQELFKAADIWQRGIARDLSQAVGAKIEAVIKSTTPDPAPAPQPEADPAAPQPEGDAPALNLDLAPAQ